MYALRFHLFLLLISFPCFSISQKIIDPDTLPYKFYPQVNSEKVKLSSPFVTPEGEAYVIALTIEECCAIIPVTIHKDRGICDQTTIDSLDFPTLVQTGLHNEENLANLNSITGRKVEEINSLAKPGQLSSGGFIADDEDIVSVLKGDNELVRKMGFTHPQLAACLFHVFNLMDEDLKLNRWNMARHQWEYIKGFWYNAVYINVKSFDTKGGQKSIFDDGIMGAFHTQLWRQLEPIELDFLKQRYPHLPNEKFDLMIDKLSFINTGEMQPQYIKRYGFYEGHTFWRTDPIAIAWIFGLLNLEELDHILSGKLDEAILNHYN